jgi:hypothetical protein
MFEGEDSAAMQATTWQIQKQNAVLRSVGLSTQIDLAQSCDGLTHVVAGGKLWHAARLLGLAKVSPKSASASPPTPPSSLKQDDITEHYVRGNDLVLTYGPQTAGTDAMRIDALWRVITPETGDKFIAAVDLVVSVQTPNLDVQADLLVQSVLPTQESLRLMTVNPIHYQPLANTGGITTLLEPENGLGCLLFRQAGLNVSYVEMVHPSDFHHDEFVQSGLAKNESCLMHHLFHATLEKGVALRSRVRGLFIPRIDDVRIAAECYNEFVVSDPPLGT